ncbi:MAG TPA: CSLREA domain-containing protein, partial [Solirubrobacteraceae bacterium]|nr:CSLREA domain-containing protein [Solirubrobacteraceae bacterium]
MIVRRSTRGLVPVCRTVALAVGACACALLVGSAVAAAATLRVTTTRDELRARDGKCSLREAIEAVDLPQARSDCGRASHGSNTIVLGSGRYLLSIPRVGADGNASGDLNVGGTARLTIIGTSSRLTVIDAAGLGDRVLSVASGARLRLSRLQITGGRAPAGSPGASGAPGNVCPETLGGWRMRTH